jgi:putative proteasome-type protease
MEDDREHRLFQIYPQGNWIEVDHGSPYVMIGETSFGKPLLDRFWKYDRTLEEALRVGLLAFDATRTSASSVSPPADAVLFRTGGYSMLQHRFTADDMEPIFDYWRATITAGVEGASSLTAPLFRRLEGDPAHSPVPGSL